MPSFLVEATLLRSTRYFRAKNTGATDTQEATQWLLDALNDGQLKWVPMAIDPSLKKDGARLVNTAHVVSLKVLEEIDEA